MPISSFTCDDLAAEIFQIKGHFAAVILILSAEIHRFIGTAPIFCKHWGAVLQHLDEVTGE